MAYSGVGGQAVMEGVMMKNKDIYAIAVRKPDQTIDVTTEHYGTSKQYKIFRKVPIVRGVISFVDSLYLGMHSLMHSASFWEEEDESEKKKDIDPKKEKAQEKAVMTGTVIFSIVAAFAIFFALPYYLSVFVGRWVFNPWLIASIEGVLRMVIFIGYVALISLTKDIRRVYMYHGAEHKCINCIESGLPLDVDNVRKSTRFHKRCGTSFLLVVMIISIVVFMFIRVDSRVLRLVFRLLLIPVIAGISYEFIRLAGRYDNLLIRILSQPGLWLQRITTKEPDDEMIEVGIASVEAVFDWKKWQEEQGE
ncbi:DUF1385 domain-containing protein [Agathobacter ruminis]|uniref:DUF1385 domain-containing protein n=1 Tax=Agathobacter ruminis TaxID=1712665 RepID=A0A2G3E195_9FIRM|nr:DUF1385 domain-containing protein [Agathobacter ruminis]MDC7301359.1 DUF1385 domain-containing protein [Agathobacter ruminis]PHU36925.1 hypothetical protein CSX02_10500 [Agathobacter ruminis]